MSEGRTRDRATAPEVEEQELRLWVEHCLGAHLDGFERHPLAESTSFACELLTVQTGGRTLELFWKDYGRCALPRSSGEGSQREIEVYRQLLDPELLGTPRHLGSLHEPEEGRTWLLLERVRGPRLAERGFEDWLAPAAWLGRLQGCAAARGIAERAPVFLAVHDVADLRAVAEEAVRAVAAVDLLLVPDLLDALEGYEGTLEQLSEQPRTLVHGSFRPENILLERTITPVRVAPVDWEYAAVGCALYDVAFLTAGFGREKAERLLCAHREAAREHGLRLPEGEEAWELVTSLRLHKLLRSLGRSQRWGYAHETIEHLIALAGRLKLELRETRARRGRARILAPRGLACAEPHPALRAWRSLGRDELVSDVERIRGRFFGPKGRVLYRLRIDEPRPSTVVAKCSRRATLATERLVHAELLPPLGLSSPRYLGWFGDGSRSWLFLEDVGTSRLVPDDDAQRACALRWLGGLHAASANMVPDPRLNALGVQWFRERLGEARRSILSALENPALLPGDHPRLNDVLAVCGRLDSGWERIEALCAAMPATLVHGDFRPKNIFLQRGEAEYRLLPIDWEYAGRGIPALDLGTLLRDTCSPADLEIYGDAFGSGARASTRDLSAWVSVGRILRALVSIRWESIGLSYSSGLEKPVRNLCSYARSLERAFEELARA